MMRPSTVRLTKILFFPMYAVLIYALQQAMATLPNIELTSMLVMLATLLFRWEGLIPVYLYIFIMGVRWGFPTWWIPYLYLWAVLWAVTMLLPRRMPVRAAAAVYPIVCALFGLCYGTLYAPAQALLFGLSFRQLPAWILAGLPFDLLHAGGNLIAGLLILPLYTVLRKVIPLSSTQEN